jgi:hypothetical protein
MNEQQERTLREGLKALARTTRDASASRNVEAAVLAEMRRMAAATPAPSRRAWLPLAAALFITSASGAWIAHTSAPVKARPVRPAGFVAIPGTALLPPLESGAIVRVELPITELPAYGIPIVPEMGASVVEADLLVAQDGQARAIRLVNDSHSRRSTP